MDTILAEIALKDAENAHVSEWLFSTNMSRCVPLDLVDSVSSRCITGFGLLYYGQNYLIYPSAFPPGSRTGVDGYPFVLSG